MRPIDVLNDARSKNVVGFCRVESLRCCYFCRHLSPELSSWKCSKHLVCFGDDGDSQTISCMVEFVCDSFDELLSSVETE